MGPPALILFQQARRGIMDDLAQHSTAERLGMVAVMAVAAAIAATAINIPKAYADRPDAPNLGNFGAIGCIAVADGDGGFMVDVTGTYVANRTAIVAPLVTTDPRLASTMFLTVDGVARQSMTIPASPDHADIHIGLRQVSGSGPAFINTKWADTLGAASYTFISVHPDGHGKMSCIISDG